MKVPKAIVRLIEELQKLPTVGPKTAERLTYFLLRVPGEELEALSGAIRNLKDEIKVCQNCFNYAASDLCEICADPNRNQSLICVVEEPLDVLAVEKTGKFSGVYHVLGGRLNPVAGIGPEEIRVAELLARLQQRPGFGERSPSSSSMATLEIILATNPTLEGEATAMYLRKKIKSLPRGEALRGEKLKMKNEIRITRIARGLPTGGDLGYADEVTVGRAIEGRSEY